MNIKLKFKVQEPASFFHFLDSISQWDIHTRPYVRRYYENRFGINREDKEIIKKYIKIRKKYPWKLLDSDFVPAKDFDEVKKNLKKRLTKKEFSEMKDIIDYFYPSIHKIYLEWYNLLIRRKKRLEKEVEAHNTNDILGEIKKFYESKYRLKEINIHLLINPEKWASGGNAAIRPPAHIVIEPLNLKGNNLKHIKYNIPTIIHESLHLIESGIPSKKWKDFRKKIEKEDLDFHIFREAIADTIAPHGLLTKKYGLIKKSVQISKHLRYPKKDEGRRIYYRKMRVKLSAYLYPLTKKQFDKKLSIFEGDYIDNCTKEFKKMMSRYKRSKKQSKK